MSKPRQSPIVRSYAVTHPPNLQLAWRTIDDYNQLIYASKGVMEVWTPLGRWVVPPHRAVWIPARVEHEVRMAGRVSLRSVFFLRGMGRGRVPKVCTAINVSALLRELILHTTRVGVLWGRRPEHARLARVMLDQLQAAPEVPLQLPMPKDPRAVQAAELILADPGDDLERISGCCGASRRTLERTFARETGLALGRWRQRARLVAALRGLAEGRPVGVVADDAGYQTASAFVAAFRTQLGVTPAKYFG